MFGSTQMNRRLCESLTMTQHAATTAHIPVVPSQVPSAHQLPLPHIAAEWPERLAPPKTRIPYQIKICHVI